MIFSYGHKASTGSPMASAMALRSLLDLRQPAITLVIADRVTPARRPISAAEISFLSNSIFIFVDCDNMDTII